MKIYVVTYTTGAKWECAGGVMIVVAEDKRSALKLAKAELAELGPGYTLEDIEIVRTAKAGVPFNQEPVVE